MKGITEIYATSDINPMYKNAFAKINKFFELDLQKNPEGIFKVLKEILDFDSGTISISDKYSYNNNLEPKFKISAPLKIKNAVLGEIEIKRNTNFTQEERNILETCASIIAGIIKDAEMSQIISQQIKTLEEGIYETNRAYKSAKNQNDFFANFSHELRTPLNAVISSSELLAEGIFGPLNKKQTEYINDIRISALHLLGMINDILDMAKLDAKSMKLNPTTFELSQTSDEVCNIIKPLAQKKNITIQKHYDKNTAITADYTKIQQILFNLITNAIKYTPENGKIDIYIEKQTPDIILRVKDNGIGIAPEFHEKIFEKFVQLGGAKNSNGLGLTITKELVKLHKGKIFVESSPCEGSEFKILLPVKYL